VRSSLLKYKEKGYEVSFPSLKLCTDNGAMVAGLGYRYIKDGFKSDWDLSASARVAAFKKA
jgi:N6-L-threonylcarbamoyladenine synthase